MLKNLLASYLIAQTIMALVKRNKIMIKTEQCNESLSIKLSCWMLTGFVALALCGHARADGGLSPSTAITSSYKLHVDDQLVVSVLNHDDYTKSVTVLSDGTFNYPIVGTVSATGHTIKQLERELEKGLSTEIDDPQVTVSITQFQGDQVGVVGSVSKSGSYPYVAGWHILDAIAAANGINVPTNLAEITLLRGDSVVQVNAYSLMDGSDPSQNLTLEPGDKVLVQQKGTNLANVQVSGEVKNIGSFPVPA
jgi:polysaccharide export outer membrane protein